MKEEWKDIPDWKGSYQASNHGRVRSLDREVIANGKYQVKGKILKQTDNGTGYSWVSLHKGGKGKHSYVHRLVYSAFSGKPNGEVNHRDLDRGNNHLYNLEDVTRQENVEHSHAKNFTFTSPAGYEYKIHNLNKFCRNNNLGLSNMHRVHKGERKTHKGWSSSQ